MAKQAIPYIRFSSVKQTEGNSYQRQKEAVDKWCAQHSEYTRSNLVFEDLGRSGFSTKASKKASGMFKIREAIEAGLIKAGDAILIEAFDRATRQQALDAFELITPILKAGVSIITLDDRVEYTRESLNGSQAFLLVAKIQAAHGYSKILSERVRQSYEIRREKARGGEIVKRFTPVWLDANGTVIRDVADQISLVFDWYIAGMGKHTIAARIRSSGVEKLAKCSGPTVQGWLTNAAAIGAWANKDSTADSIPNVYPAIIEAEKFYLVQRLLNERATVRGRTSKHFLVGLVKCAHCEKSMVMHRAQGRPIAMRCLTHHRLKAVGCLNSKSIPINVIRYVQVLTSNLAFKRAIAKHTLSASEKRRLTVEAEIDKVTREIGKLVTLALTVDLPEVEERLIGLKEQRKGLESELKAIEGGDKVLSDSIKVLRDESTLLDSDPVVLNALLKDAGYAVRCDVEGHITNTENNHGWDYLGVKRKPRSNCTEAFRLRECLGSNVLLINPDASIATLPIYGNAAAQEVDIRYQRYADLVIGQESEEEEHLDPPYVQWK